MMQAYEQGNQDILKAEARTVFVLERVMLNKNLLFPSIKIVGVAKTTIITT